MGLNAHSFVVMSFFGDPRNRIFWWWGPRHAVPSKKHLETHRVSRDWVNWLTWVVISRPSPRGAFVGRGEEPKPPAWGAGWMIRNLIVVGQVTLEQMKCFGNLGDERLRVDELALSRLLVLKICGFEQCVNLGLSSMGEEIIFPSCNAISKALLIMNGNKTSKPWCFHGPGHPLPVKLGWVCWNDACLWIEYSIWKNLWTMLT